MSFGITAIVTAIAGIATSISLSVASISQQRKAAKAQLQAQSMQAKVSSDQRIKQIRRVASQQKASFLSSGISLTGDGTPDAVISETYQTGIEDVENIRNYGATMGASVSANARAKMLSTYGQLASDVSSFASSAFKGAGTLKAAGTDTINVGGGLEGMGDSYGNFGTGSGSQLNFDAYQAPSSFGGGYGV